MRFSHLPLMCSAFATALMSSVVFTPAQAQDIQCGQTYTVRAGDYLTAIATRAYGRGTEFAVIHSANRDIIGPNPALIRIGQRLEIPCLDGDLGTSVASSSAIRPQQTTELLPIQNSRQIRVVTGTDWAPFTNEDQAQGGMIVEMTNVALASADSKPDYKIDFVNDWGAHLQPLISDHAYDFSLAWFRPNCDFIDKLGDGSKFRCNNLDWSEPMFEQLFGYYTRASEAPLATYSGLFGKTICRPSGYAIFQLEENDLVAPNVELVRPASPVECFEGLRDGRFDAVALAVDTAEGAIAELGMRDAVLLNEPLSQVLTIHAVISKNHPRGKELLAILNNGINNIKDNGEWFSIIRRHLAEHRSVTSG